MDELVVEPGRGEDANAIVPLVFDAHRPFYEYCFHGSGEALRRFLELSVRDEFSELYACRTLVARLGDVVSGVAVLSTSNERRRFGLRDAFVLRAAAGQEAAAIFRRMSAAAAGFDGRDPATLYIARLAAAPERRGRGVGAALLDAAVRRAAARGCRSLELHVAATNVRGRAFYAREGFVEIETRDASVPGLPGYITLRRHLGTDV